MKHSSPAPSSRLLRAVAAEREGLLRRQADVLDRHRQLQAELAGLDAVLADVDERLGLIDRLAGDQPAPTAASERAKVHPAVPEPKSTTELRGPMIRATAVRALLAHPQHPEALHYREWFELLSAAGYSIAGKDPLAVFLTQLSRSPVVRRGTQSGVYELDLDALGRLRLQLEGLQTRLRALTATTPTSTTQLSAIRSARSDLTRQIDRTEKALQEVEHTLQTASEYTDLAAAS